MQKHELLTLKNLGPVMLKDLIMLNINTIEDLKKQNDLDLYMHISVLKGKIQSTKIFDLCTAIIHEAKTMEKINWLDFRKARLKQMKKNLLQEYNLL